MSDVGDAGGAPLQEPGSQGQSAPDARPAGGEGDQLLPATRPAPGAMVPAETDPWALDLAAATLRLDSGDTDTLFEALGSKLERILGEAARIQREGGFRRRHRVGKIVVDLDGERLEAVRTASGPTFLSVHAVRGVTLKTEEIGADEWLGRLNHLVGRAAVRSATVRDALSGLLDS